MPGRVHGLTQLNAPLSAHTRTFPVAGDNTGPTIAWATPANGALLPGSRISGTIKATDPSGVTIALLNHYDAPKFAASIPAGTDGKHMITWWVADGVGHSRYLTRTVTVDNTGTSLTTSARTWHR